jgi:DNA-binding MarR family transcriptional regulator
MGGEDAMSRRDTERDRLLAKGSVVYREYVSAEILNGLATAEAVGLNATDFHSLNIVALAGPLTAGQLARRIGLTTSATTRMIDRLEQARFVRRVRNPADRRQVIVELRPDRQAEIDAALGPVRSRLFEVFQRFDAEQVRVLLAYFEQAAPALVAAAEELRNSARGA